MVSYEYKRNERETMPINNSKNSDETIEQMVLHIFQSRKPMAVEEELGIDTFTVC